MINPFPIARPPKSPKDETPKDPTKETAPSSEVKKRKRSGSSDVKSPAGPTTALGRPVRKSASQFSARKLLKAGIAAGSDEGSSEDADWNPTMAMRKHDSAATSSDDEKTEPSKKSHVSVGISL